jgi:hypothetical protein
MDIVIDLRRRGTGGTRARCATRRAAIGRAPALSALGANASQLVRVAARPPKHFNDKRKEAVMGSGGN